MLYRAFLALLWLQFFLALAPSWLDGTYYSYGWLAPAAMLFFWARRRKEAPRPEPQIDRIGRGLFAVFLAAGILLILLIRILQGGNPYWRLPLWVHGALVIGLTLLTVWAIDGPRALRHFLPVLIFSVLAIPLPSAVEQGFVSYLTHAVVVTGADLARLLGMPVEISEAAFLINGQPLDVNDGCSGIRSFQSSLMAGLFVGELLRLQPPSRVTLMLISIAAAFSANALRVVLLIDAFLAGGHAAMEARHDLAGFTALLLTYGMIIAAGFWLDRNSTMKESSASLPNPT